MDTRIYSVIVNWNLREDTLACVRSLIDARQPADRIIVVDNASSDGSVAALEAEHPGALTVLKNTTNVGFARGVNQGAEFALAQEAEWVFLLNNDTVVDPAIFAAFEKGIRDHPEYRIFGPLILYYAEPAKIWFFGDRLRGSSLVTTSLYKNQSRYQPLPEIASVDFVNGCGMLVHKDVFDEIGFFDESLFMYGEEVDFCWRARQSGYPCASVREAVMWHKVSRSASRVQPEMRYYQIRNQVAFYRRYARGVILPGMFLFTLVRSLVIGGLDLLHRQFRLILPLARGWLDGWFAQLPAPHYGKNHL